MIDEAETYLLIIIAIFLAAATTFAIHYVISFWGKPK